MIAEERAAIEARAASRRTWSLSDRRQVLADRDTLLAALVAAEAKIESLAEALDFQASVRLEGGFHGGDLLRAVAEYMDKIDDARGGDVDRQVQFDLRRWADDVDAALAAYREAGR